MSNEKYKEILKLHEMMVKADIPHSFKEVFGGYQIHYQKTGDELVCSAIEHNGSYGRERDLIEIMGLLTFEELKHDSVVGFLSAEDVFKRVEKHYKEKKR